MPTSSGASFLGGFELIGRLQSDRLRVPVLLMVESFEDEAREQAKTLGVRRIVYKPTLTKPDPELYRADLREFSDSVDTQLKKLIVDHREGSDAPASAGKREDGAERTEFLATMTRKLVEPGGSTDVSLLVMQVAARFLERGVLFVVKSDSARGLAGFGFGVSKKNCADVARDITLSIEDADGLTEVVSTGKTRRLGDGFEGLDGLFDEIGRGNASDGVLIPMLYNRATLLLLYGDNGVSGRALDDLGALELFMAQAGMALENKLLQRKLGSVAPSVPDKMGQGVQL
jgi:CheY-like chemotaxis protein